MSARSRSGARSVRVACVVKPETLAPSKAWWVFSISTPLIGSGAGELDDQYTEPGTDAHDHVGKLRAWSDTSGLVRLMNCVRLIGEAFNVYQNRSTMKDDSHSPAT
jgi:hypothetical protein